MDKKKPINFLPINEGLGFHPFSQGLPYTPTQPSNPRPSSSATGSGATVAGPPVFNYPKAPEIRPRADRPQPRRVVPQQTYARTPQPAKVSPSKQSFVIAPPLGIGYLSARLVAFLADLIFNVAIFGALFGFAFLSLYRDDLNYIGFSTVSVVCTTLVSCALLGIVFQEMMFGSSIGKRVFGLEIEGTPVEILIRGILFLPSLGVLGLGILFSLFNKDRMCWHDKVSGIQPRWIEE